jgi:hypothetical protein
MQGDVSLQGDNGRECQHQKQHMTASDGRWVLYSHDTTPSKQKHREIKKNVARRFYVGWVIVADGV